MREDNPSQGGNDQVLQMSFMPKKGETVAVVRSVLFTDVVVKQL